MIRKLIKKIVRKAGYKLIKKSEVQSIRDMRDDLGFQEIYKMCKPFTMTSESRMYALYHAMSYIIENEIPGDFVECGVWKGGSAMLMARYLEQHNIKNREIFLYDTFEGMTEPTSEDVDLTGRKAKTKFDEMSTGKDKSNWCFSSVNEVENNMSMTGFPKNKIHFIKGKVEETIPEFIPKKGIALLRLDTDWYESTKHELIHLYPNLSLSGVLILDDFGFWEGAKKAVLEYIEKNKIKILLNRIDVCGRIGIKTHQ